MNKQMEQYYQQIVGATITGLAVDDTDNDFGDDLWALKLKTKDGRAAIAWIMADPEGNGPGFLAIDAEDK
jgi:hypothetical protein